MQIDRLFQIVYILLEKKKITAKELSEKFEISQRTIYRDIDILSQCGIPIYTAKGRKGGISLLEGFVLNKSVMTQQEQDQIWTALQSLPRGGEEDTKKILKKYSSFFQKSNENWIQVDFSKWGKQKAVLFDMLKKAIFHKNVISFFYYNSRGEKTFRTAEPYQLWFKQNNWYMKAYCREKEDFRIFKVSRMKCVNITEDIFERAEQQQIENCSNDAMDMVTVVLEIKKSMAYRVYDEFEEEQIACKKNGDFLVTMKYIENQWLYGYILSWGAYAFVREPDHIRKKIEKELKNMINKYKI